jgi:hypothetical protein
MQDEVSIKVIASPHPTGPGKLKGGWALMANANQAQAASASSHARTLGKAHLGPNAAMHMQHAVEAADQASARAQSSWVCRACLRRCVVRLDGK